jgi:hypothetical protein
MISRDLWAYVIERWPRKHTDFSIFADLWGVGDKHIHIVMDNLDPATPMAAFTDLSEAHQYLEQARRHYHGAFVAHCRLK